MDGRISEGTVWYRSLPHILAVFMLTACGGGGCGCEGCGVAPIPGGFKIEERVANSTQIRLTENGIAWLEDNADALVALLLPEGLAFEIPETAEDIDNPIPFLPDIRVTICPGGGCFIMGEIESLDLQPMEPNRLRANISVRLRTQDAAGAPAPLPIRALGSTCRIPIDTTGGSRDFVTIQADIDLEEETEAARAGYTKIVIAEARLADGASIENDDIGSASCSGLLGAILGPVINLLRGTIVDQIEGQVSGLLQDAIDDQLCTTQGEFGCPTGTVADDPADPDAVCRFSAGGECVPLLLGLDGQGDLGAAFLSSVSPGTHAPGQFLLAAGGEGEAVNNGMSVFMFGGFLGTSRDFSTTPAQNPCVPAIPPPPIPTIPRVATFRGNSVPGLATDPHVGIGLSESFLDHAGYGMYDAGLLCIGAGTPLAQELSTGLFSLLVPSLGRLAFPERNAPLAILLRPQTPLDFEVGAGTEEDPLLAANLERLQIDFYVWSSERFVRFMTFESDFSIPINLAVRDGEIVPEILGLNASNSSVSNQEVLLTENPEMLAGVIEDILSTFASMAFGDLGGFELPEIMGLELQVPDGGIRGIEEGGEEFLGIFANLAVAGGPMPLSAPVDTFVEVSPVQLDPSVMTIENWGNGEIPSVLLELDASGPEGVEYEYSVRLDGMQWSDWTTEREFEFSSRTLLFQAHHTLEARARVAGEPLSVDLTPAMADVLVDILEPEVELERVTGGVMVTGFDVISEQLLVRFREAEGIWSDWAVLQEDHLIGTDTENLEVEIQDEAGNVGSASSALIRGRPNPAGGGGCACSVPGQDDNRPAGGLLLLALFGLVLRPRKTRAEKPASKGGLARRFLYFVLPTVLAIAGCDCGGNGGPDDGGTTDGFVPTDTPVDTAPAGPLDEGQLATHLSMTALTDGSLFLAGYSPGVPPSTRYGDLVVGAWDPSSQTVAWEIIDGRPDGPVTNDPTGWRGGVSDPGDDVGQFTSIQNSDSTLLVSYFDATNGALKFASGTTGSWTSHTVDDDGWAGTYSSLITTTTGVAVAYLGVNPPAALPGRPTSEVRVATAPGVPSGPTAWTVTRIGTGEFDCRPQFCPDGASCLEDGMCVADPGDAEPLDDPFIEDRPPAIGLFPSIATTTSGMALVYYDRSAGNILGAEFDGAAWGTPFLIDGFGIGDPDVGDSGIGASLAVDAGGNWHVTYVDGAEETLRYARIETGGIVATREIIDDGTTDGTTPHSDGRHIVGDDSSLVVTDGGELRVAYQDATAQTAVFARSSGDGTWAISVLDANDSAGYFTSQVLVGTTSFVAHWWRQQMRSMPGNGVRVADID
ncbi:MAG: MYXO-CTERM sorting domain-containing protein [Myxococcota bacterium]